MAKRLLESGALSLAQITERVGYLDVATFSTLFKRLAGQSPAQYRRGFNTRVAGSRDIVMIMWPYKKVLAHRGGGKLAPENTIAGLKCGLAHGFRAVEFDVMLARDGVPVVMHDPYLGRTVAGSGNVFDYDAAELAAMDAGGWFGKQFEGEPVPLFADFAALLQGQRHLDEYRDQAGAGVRGADRQGGGRRRRAPCSPPKSPPARWRRCRCCPRSAKRRWPPRSEAAPDLPRALLLDAVPRNWLPRARALGAVAIHTNHKHLTRASWRARSGWPASACFATPSTTRSARANC